MTETHIGRIDIERGLRALGVTPGDVVEAHVSLSAFGRVRGGADAVVDALIGVVGEQGALVMSAYRVGPPVPLSDAERARGLTWKVRILPEDHDERTGMGAVADTLRRRPDTVTGTGVHRTCAWGADAGLHANGFAPLIEADGLALLLGVGIDRCSSMHLAEGAVGVPAEIRRLSEPPDDIIRDYPEDEWAIGFGGPPNDAWQTVWEEAVERGLVRTGRIGDALCHVFRARAMEGILERRLRADPHALYGVPKPA